MCKSQEPPQQQAPQRQYSSRPCQQLQQRSTPQQTRYIGDEISENTMTDSNEWGIFTVHSQLETTQPSINVELQINNVGVVMELDTGASLTIMSEKIQQKMPNLELQPSIVTLKTYSGEQLKVLGQAQVKVIYKTQEVDPLLVVVAGEGPTLFGRNWLQLIQLDWKDI